MLSRSRGIIVRAACVVGLALGPSTKTIAQIGADSVLSMLRTSLRSTSSISYKATLSMKFSNMPDTFRFEDRAWLMRVEDDSIFGGLIRFTTGEDGFKTYDGRHIFACDELTDSCTRFDPNKGGTSAMKQDMRTLLIWWDFLDPENINYLLKPERQRLLLADTTIAGSSCWHVRSIRPPRSDEGEVISDLCISKKDMVVLLDEFRVVVQGDVQYSRRELLSHELNAYSAADFTLEKLLPGAIVSDPAPYAPAPLLAIGDPAPPLHGDLYGSTPAIDSITFIGHVTFIDFWYMSCPPCRTSIPVVDSLYIVYKDRGVRFVGVNAMDKKYDKLGLLPDFLKNRPISYQLLIADPEIEAAYRVIGHPVFYIIDRDGRVVTAYQGYGNGMARLWAEKLDELLGLK